MAAVPPWHAQCHARRPVATPASLSLAAYPDHTALWHALAVNRQQCAATRVGPSVLLEHLCQYHAALDTIASIVGPSAPWATTLVWHVNNTACPSGTIGREMAHVTYQIAVTLVALAHAERDAAHVYMLWRAVTAAYAYLVAEHAHGVTNDEDDDTSTAHAYEDVAWCNALYCLLRAANRPRPVLAQQFRDTAERVRMSYFTDAHGDPATVAHVIALCNYATAAAPKTQRSGISILIDDTDSDKDDEDKEDDNVMEDKDDSNNMLTSLFQKHRRAFIAVHDDDLARLRVARTRVAARQPMDATLVGTPLVDILGTTAAADIRARAMRDTALAALVESAVYYGVLVTRANEGRDPDAQAAATRVWQSVQTLMKDTMLWRDQTGNRNM